MAKVVQGTISPGVQHTVQVLHCTSSPLREKYQQMSSRGGGIDKRKKKEIKKGENIQKQAK
jgi:hypothetical protein